MSRCERLNSESPDLRSLGRTSYKGGLRKLMKEKRFVHRQTFTSRPLLRVDRELLGREDRKVGDDRETYAVRPEWVVGFHD